MRQIDARAVSLGLPVYLMMENAGNALARHMIKGLGLQSKKKTVTVMCGLSNNGGGGFASARHMRYYGANVNVILLGRPKDIKTKDAKLQWKTLEKFESILKISVITKADLKRAKEMITNADGIIDAIFGTGYLGKIIKEPQRSAIELINSSKAYIISNDVPSGTNADTGEVLDISVLPDTIVVLHRMKPGITMKKGRGFVVESIGIPSDVEKEIS